MDKFKYHPSILLIKAKVCGNDTFSFKPVTIKDMESEIKRLDIHKPTTFNNIPAKILVNNYDICSPSLCAIFNDSIKNAVFPHSLKLADIIPVHKKYDSTDKSNYRPISILPTVSKLFERLMYDQAAYYMNCYFSPYLCGFSSGYGTQ